MIRNEVYDENGTVLSAEVIDLDAHTYTREEAGQVVESRALSAEERERYAPQPPDPATVAAINHARSLGFTDDMIRVMYPALAGAL